MGIPRELRGDTKEGKFAIYVHLMKRLWEEIWTVGLRIRRS